MRLNNNELGKHVKYHCHLNNEEKSYFPTLQNEGIINRKNPREIGLPNEELIVGNNTVRYDPINKEWKCLQCTYKRSKYERQQVLNHANSKHNQTTNNPRERGMHIEKNDDITIRMETDYGRIRTQYEPDNNTLDNWKRLLICTICNYGNEKKKEE